MKSYKPTVTVDTSAIVKWFKISEIERIEENSK